jgi:hypothetical protein
VNRVRLSLLGSVALALGVFVSCTVYRDLQSKAGDTNAPGIDVVIAATDLQVGSKIGDKDVKVVQFPAGDLPPNCFHQKSSVVGRGWCCRSLRGNSFCPISWPAKTRDQGCHSTLSSMTSSASFILTSVIFILKVVTQNPFLLKVVVNHQLLFNSNSVVLTNPKPGETIRIADMLPILSPVPALPLQSNAVIFLLYPAIYGLSCTDVA